MRPRSRPRSRWLALVTASPPARAANNGIAASAPLMGWSTWNSVAYSPSAAKDEAEASALVSTGLKADGYDHINQDDFWYGCPGSQGPDVDSYGRWATNASEFPNSGPTPGMEVLANYVHSLGLKFGLYVTPGISDQAVSENTPIEGTSYTADEIANGASEANFNCGGMQGIDYSKPGAQAFVNSWADELASWGIDYLKIDGVGPSDIADVTAWSTALKQAGRPIALELSNQLSISDASTWQSLSNGWRTGNDIGSTRPPTGSPTRDPAAGTTAVIAADQDGIPADRVIDSGSEQVFDKRQQNGTWDIGIFNTDTSASHTFSVPLAQLGLSGPASITDLWSGASDGSSTGTLTTTVAPGGVTFIAATPSSGTGGTGELVSAQSGDCLDTAGGSSPGPTSTPPATRSRSTAATAASTRSSPRPQPASSAPWAPPSASTPTTTRHRPAPRSSYGRATAAPTRNGPPKATARSSASSPGCAWKLHPSRRGRLHGHRRRRHREWHPHPAVHLQRHRRSAMDRRGQRLTRQPAVGPLPRRPRLQHRQRHPARHLGLQRRRQPALDPSPREPASNPRAGQANTLGLQLEQYPCKSGAAGTNQGFATS